MKFREITTFEEFNELSSFVLKLILTTEYSLVKFENINLIKKIISDLINFSKENYNIKPFLILLNQVFDKINDLKLYFDEETFSSYILMKIDFENLNKYYSNSNILIEN
ncbi:hypothetical protein [Clostridium perfringens]|uniref:hypothetical protein n=1 Tax=Clostridium perfringens TaxID=1502 RepID=UPI003A0FC7C5